MIHSWSKPNVNPSTNLLWNILLFPEIAIIFFIFARFCGLTSVAQAALQLGVIILPQSPEYWDYKYKPPRILDIFVLRSQLLYTIVHISPL